MKKNDLIALNPHEEKIANFAMPNIPLAPGEYYFFVNAKDNDSNKTIYHKLKKTAEFTVPEYSALNTEPGATEQSMGPIIIDFDCDIR